MIGTRLAAIIVVASLVTLGGCATPHATQVVAPVDRQTALNALIEFSFSGGLGIWTDEQSVSARVQWQQSGDKLSVSLTGPLGIGELVLSKSSGIATLSRSGSVVSSGSNVDQVLQAGLGLAAPVPVEQLKSWVRGLPGEATSVVTDEQGKLSSLRFTDGQGTRWQARFLRYTHLDGLGVPALITASGGQYSVRLLLKNWQPTVNFRKRTVKRPNTRLAIPGR